MLLSLLPPANSAPARASRRFCLQIAPPWRRPRQPSPEPSPEPLIVLATVPAPIAHTRGGHLSQPGGDPPGPPTPCRRRERHRSHRNRIECEIYTAPTATRPPPISQNQGQDRVCALRPANPTNIGPPPNPFHYLQFPVAPPEWLMMDPPGSVGLESCGTPCFVLGPCGGRLTTKVFGSAPWQTSNTNVGSRMGCCHYETELRRRSPGGPPRQIAGHYRCPEQGQQLQRFSVLPG